MSLINDALKRARAEALRQEEDGRRTEYRTVPAHSWRSDRQRQLLIAGWVIAALALALVVGMWVRFGSEAPTVAERGVEPGAQALPESGGGSPRPTASPADGSPTSSNLAPSASERVPVSPPSAGQSVASSAPPADADSEAAAVDGGAPSSGASAQQPQPRGGKAGDGDSASPAGGRQGSSPLEPGATYLRRVRTADGSVAELGGIAYSESRPIAVINGSVVSTGDFIGGFTVIAVEPERVELEADGVRIFLALR
ncbi:MAG: hypothetical protein R3244_02265 [Thermoanaerobaculia bacterium]|nr:hypothetical protein [Thermoanaerobaculia bacterium]